MSAESSVICVADVHAVLGEGPVWVARETALYWVDIKGLKIFRLNEDGRVDEWATPLRVGSLAPRKSGGFIGGTEDGIAIIDPAAERFELVAKPEEHLPHNRFNDGKADRRGRFWAGSMDDTEKDSTGTLYCVEQDLGVTAVDGDYKVTNGPAFSPSGDVMYHNDSARQVVYAFDMDSAGKPGERRVFMQFGPGDGYPDGMTVDAEGCLWIAFWDGWAVRRYSPKGEWLQTVRMPVSRPTSCAFGGRDLDRLYITSASIGLDESALQMQPNAGGLFMMTPGVRGLADAPFAG
jgi:xylono-1,5-lactonase